MGHHQTTTFDLIWCAGVIVITAFFVIRHAIQRMLRAMEIRRYAEERKLEYLGSTIPETLALRTYVEDDRVSNCVQGKKHGHDYVAFDLRVRVGKSSHYRTVVGVRTNDGRGLASGMFQSHTDMEMTQLGPWAIHHRHRTLIPTKSLDEWTDGIIREAIGIS